MAPLESEDLHAMIVRTDERTHTLSVDIAEIKKDFREFKKHYITKEEFTPVKNVVYGGVGVMLMGITTALVALVVNK